MVGIEHDVEPRFGEDMRVNARRCRSRPQDGNGRCGRNAVWRFQMHVPAQIPSRCRNSPRVSQKAGEIGTAGGLSTLLAASRGLNHWARKSTKTRTFAGR